MVPDSSVEPSCSTSSSDHKLKHKKFYFNMRNNLFLLSMAEHSTPREGVESPYLETFQSHLDTFLCHLLWVTLPWQDIG